MTANVNKALRKEIYRRDGYRCALCDSTNGLQIHHVVPRGEGGPRENPANMICLCWKCHAAAHGTYHPDYPDYIDADYIRQSIVEYLSDYYAEVYGRPWNPWETYGDPGGMDAVKAERLAGNLPF